MSSRTVSFPPATLSKSYICRGCPVRTIDQFPRSTIFETERMPKVLRYLTAFSGVFPPWRPLTSARRNLSQEEVREETETEAFPCGSSGSRVNFSFRPRIAPISRAIPRWERQSGRLGRISISKTVSSRPRYFRTSYEPTGASSGRMWMPLRSSSLCPAFSTPSSDKEQHMPLEGQPRMEEALMVSPMAGS
jgi:hypothetical protein